METLRTLWETFFDLESMREALPEMLTVGLRNTLLLALVSAVLGTALGMLLAVAGLARTRWLRWPARIYTDVLRGLPAAVTILLIGVGLAPLGLAWWGPNPYPLGILALSLIAAAYIGEIFRSGIQSVEATQLEATRALGLSHAAAMRLVIIPQGIRRVLPAWVNQLIALIKDSSLVYFLGLVASQRELFRIGQDYAANTGNESALLLAGLFYLAITVPLTHLVNWVDRRLRDGGPASEPEDDPAEEADEVSSASDEPPPAALGRAPRPTPDKTLPASNEAPPASTDALPAPDEALSATTTGGATDAGH
ncbi:ABC transporter permease subunit [Micromonospora sp. HM5-17]|uniref:ABC transporter permease subunit n=1 Tax=Micromonospora sp. HM5-17 TaxID=2487710 RepID=UPI001EEAEE73|nr:ABC transporter permease subunit [Micromonospora sp. HM5-17]